MLIINIKYISHDALIMKAYSLQTFRVCHSLYEVSKCLLDVQIACV